MPEKSDNLQCNVEKWLNSEGYPLEYRTYMALSRQLPGNAGLGMYVKSNDGELREIDVYNGFARFSYATDVGLQVRIICECKYSKDKPWILLYGNKNKSDISDWGRTPRTLSLMDTSNLSEDIHRELRKSFYFAEGVPLAHNLVQMNKQDNRDQAYNSLMKITHAAWDYLAVMKDIPSRWFAMVFPCLVVDGPLFGASFNPEKNQIVAKSMKYGRLCWNGCDCSTNVDVVQASALDEYCKKVGESFPIIMHVLQSLSDR